MVPLILLKLIPINIVVVNFPHYADFGSFLAQKAFKGLRTDLWICFLPILVLYDKSLNYDTNFIYHVSWDEEWCIHPYFTLLSGELLINQV